jgi:hypothetical protein
MKKKGRFFVWLLPATWAACSLIHNQFPGEDYSMCLVASAPGAWIALLIDVGDIHNPAIPISIALTGSIVMAAVGLLMDMAPVNRRIWRTVFAVGVCAVFGAAVMSRGSLERALADSGSLRAGVFLSIGAGVYLSAVATLAEAGLARIWRQERKKQVI